MKQCIYTLLTVLTISFLFSCKNENNQASEVENESKQSLSASSSEIDSISYAVGIDLGEQLKTNPQNFNLEMVAQAISDVKNGQAKMTHQEAFIHLQMYQQRQMEQQMGARPAGYSEEDLKNFEQKNKSAGEKFLAENKKKQGITTLPSGLQYKIEKEGTGAKPKATDVVEVHYRGTLLDGTEFDSSYGRGETTTFPLNGVIAGWTEGLQQVKEGSKVMFYIPQELAYGATPRPGGPIEPYMALIFEVELIKIVPQE